jgi:hypothetical protein
MTWQKVEITQDGERTIIGYAFPLPSESEQQRFPYRVMLVAEYGKEGSHRLPNAVEQQRFDAYQSAVTSDLERDAFGVVVVSISSDGLYQLIAYAKDGPRGEARVLSALPKPEESSTPKQLEVLQYASERDPQWSYVSALLKRIKP